MLSVSHLHAVRDDRPLFERVSFTLTPGKILQVAGPNGAGKTTLLNLIVGLTRPEGGEVRWRDSPVSDDPARFRRECSYLGHLLGLKLLLSPLENLQWLCSLRGQTPVTPELMKALKKVGLEGYEDTPVGQLSAGQKRRVALARLFVEKTPLWVLDEPFTAIDHAGVERLEGWLADHARAGGMILMTTHHRFPEGFPVERLELDRFRSREGV